MRIIVWRLTLGFRPLHSGLAQCFMTGGAGLRHDSGTTQAWLKRQQQVHVIIFWLTIAAVTLMLAP